ncbi:MAG TPA: glycosyltransferase [Steroidobacteraceae bacterium]
MPTPLAQAHPGAKLVTGRGGNVLLLSMRRLANLVAYCMAYEFEDVISAVTGADRIDADNQPALELSRRAYKLTRAATRSRRLARALAPPPTTVTLQRDYELFFPIFNHTHELYTLATIPAWRKRCRYAACFVSELWLHLLPSYLLELLSDFDHIFLGVYHCVDQVARITGRPCSYLPPATDVLRFAPAPQFPQRSIDIYNIGRRSNITHQALLRAARERGIFYCYDTVASSGVDAKQRTFRVQSPSEHRLLLASMLQRSRYYVANRARVNEPEYTRGRDEISGRFYEGAAAGTVMIGEAPRLKAFARQFDWTDAVIHVPFDSPDIVQILAQLDADPQRLARIRRDNVINAALRHDWLYRICSVFDTFRLPFTPDMSLRKERLQGLATLPETVWPAEPCQRTMSVGARPPPQFSVVIPTCNRETTVDRALRSVAAQSFDDYEVIVVDDASTDGTPELLQAVRSERCHLIRNEIRLGVSAARNRGVQAATGQWIVFLDDDDHLIPGALAALDNRMTEFPQVDFLWGTRVVQERDAAGRYIRQREDDWAGVPATVKGSAFLSLGLRVGTNSAFTIRRSVLLGLGGFDEQLPLSEDRDLFISLAQRGFTGSVIPQQLIHVDERNVSLSRSDGQMVGAAIDLQVIDKHREYLCRPEHSEFLDRYLCAILAGYLKVGDRPAAMRIMRELRARGALNYGVLRQYVRHAPEFRALKRVMRYDSIRRMAHRLTGTRPA